MIVRIDFLVTEKRKLAVVTLVILNKINQSIIQSVNRSIIITAECLGQDSHLFLWFLISCVVVAEVWLYIVLYIAL